MDSVVQKGLYSAHFQRNCNQKKDRTGWRAHTRRSVLLKIKKKIDIWNILKVTGVRSGTSPRRKRDDVRPGRVQNWFSWTESAV